MITTSPVKVISNSSQIIAKNLTELNLKGCVSIPTAPNTKLSNFLKNSKCATDN